MPYFAGHYTQETGEHYVDGRPKVHKKSVLVPATTEDMARPLIEAHLASYRKRTTLPIQLVEITER